VLRIVKCARCVVRPMCVCFATSSLLVVDGDVRKDKEADWHTETPASLKCITMLFNLLISLIMDLSH